MEMTSQIRVSPELQQFLRKEYEEYVSSTVMTEEEQTALLKWVSEGNSPFANPANITD